MTEEKGDLVGAINELFQSANNGKQLIASAIGEPLNAEDTFSAMSTDINSLLSTFKTNMMNNGVTVESGDKFKTLIDKIATLADNEGKGVQVISGNISECSNYYTFGSDDYYYMTLDYIPTIIYISTSFNQKYGSMSLGTGECTVVYNSLDDLGILISITGSTAYGEVCRIVPTVSSDGVYYFPIMPYINENNTVNELTECEYNIITVGEEDTTLRDSLASILEEEGVSVTEEDDMASLINKVDEEFDRKNYLIPEKLYIYNRGTYDVTINKIDKYTTLNDDNIFINTYISNSTSGSYYSTSVLFEQQIDTDTYPYLYISLKKESGDYADDSGNANVPTLTLNGKSIKIDEGTVRLDTSSFSSSVESININAKGVKLYIYEIYLSNM